MRILITGVCGFVGSSLAEALLEGNMATQIIGMDNLSRAGSEINRSRMQQLGISIIPGDIRIQSDIDALPAVDWVIDAAANPSVLAGIDGKTSSRQLVEHNLLGTINLLEYCKKHSAGFILPSTSRAYSIPPLANMEMLETDHAFTPDPDQDFPPGLSVKGVTEAFDTSPPVSLYGSTKVASEHLALEYGQTFDFPVWINRCGVLAGKGQFGHPMQGIFAFWIHSFRERSPLKYIGFGGNGYQVRDCLHPTELANLIVKQMNEPANSSKPRTVNVSGGIENSISLRQLSDWCRDRFKPMTVASPSEYRTFDIPWMVLDTSLAKQVWDWQPTIRIEEILEEIANFADSRPDWLSIVSQ